MSSSIRFLYSVYGSVKAATAKDARLIAYRNSWLDALLIGRKIEAVIALGTAADAAWQAWKQTPSGKTFNVAYAPVYSSYGAGEFFEKTTRRNWLTRPRSCSKTGTLDCR